MFIILLFIIYYLLFNYLLFNNNIKDNNSKGNGNNDIEHDIAIVNGTVNDHSAAVLVDGGSNTNLVTRNFLNKNIKNYTTVGSMSASTNNLNLACVFKKNYYAKY